MAIFRVCDAESHVFPLPRHLSVVALSDLKSTDKTYQFDVVSQTLGPHSSPCLQPFDFIFLGDSSWRHRSSLELSERTGKVTLNTFIAERRLGSLFV